MGPIFGHALSNARVSLGPVYIGHYVVRLFINVFRDICDTIREGFGAKVCLCSVVMFTYPITLGMVVNYYINNAQ